MAIHWKAVKQYFTVVLFVVQFEAVCNFGKYINFGLGIVRSERINVQILIADVVGRSKINCEGGRWLGLMGWVC